MPRFLGALMVFAGLGWLTFLYEPLADHLSPYIQVLGIIAEVLLMLWLLGDGCERGAVGGAGRDRAIGRRVGARGRVASGAPLCTATRGRSRMVSDPSLIGKVRFARHPRTGKHRLCAESIHLRR